MTRLPIAAALPPNLAILAVGLQLCISANLLTWCGVPYMSEGGALPFKFHPGTDVLAIASLSRIAQTGLWRAWISDPVRGTYFLAIGACLMLALLLSGTGNLIVLLDSFLPAGLFAVAFENASAAQYVRLRRLMQAAIAVNAMLALAEAWLHANLIPLYLNYASYVPLSADFRPTALYDHPLTGATMTMMGFALAPAAGWPRLGYMALLGAAMLAFGGRTALAVTALGVLGWTVWHVVRLALCRDPRMTKLLLGVSCAAILALATGGALLAAGFGGRVIGHLYWDNSAQVRLAQWHILDRLEFWQIMFGTPRAEMIAQLTPLHLAAGVDVIENFWLLMFVSLGVVGFPFFLLAMASLFAWCWRRSELGGHLLLVGVLAVASTSNSLGRKSILLVELVAAVICSAGRRLPAAARLM